MDSTFATRLTFLLTPIPSGQERWIQPTSEKGTGSYDDAVDSQSNAEVITNSAAFIPFSYGPANWADRAFALLEMRMVVALLIQRFMIEFAPGYDSKEWEEHLEDFYVVANGPLSVKLTPRVCRIDGL